ncbi:hypothetical protein [Paenarthrobacter sp. C1]|uniref:hypothetical protein n=1 Tax=Paenarthrobacter sp. C1 TaxID=3400220 RepID=UPI003BF4DFFF
MEWNEPRRTRPATTAGIPLKPAAETPVKPPIRIPVGIGFTYKDKATGETWTLSGLRSGRNVILVRGDMRTPEEIRDRVSVDDLADHYDHEGCDHENFCCTLHRTHVMPHRGCIMR